MRLWNIGFKFQRGKQESEVLEVHFFCFIKGRQTGRQAVGCIIFNQSLQSPSNTISILALYVPTCRDPVSQSLSLPSERESTSRTWTERLGIILGGYLALTLESTNTHANRDNQ